MRVTVAIVFLITGCSSGTDTPQSFTSQPITVEPVQFADPVIIEPVVPGPDVIVVPTVDEIPELPPIAEPEPPGEPPAEPVADVVPVVDSLRVNHPGLAKTDYLPTWDEVLITGNYLSEEERIEVSGPHYTLDSIWWCRRQNLGAGTSWIGEIELYSNGLGVAYPGGDLFWQMDGDTIELIGNDYVRIRNIDFKFDPIRAGDDALYHFTALSNLGETVNCIKLPL